MVQHVEFFRVVLPGKFTAVHDHAAERIAMAAHVLGQGIDHHVGAPLDRLDQGRRRHGIVHDQRHAMLVGHVRQGLDVNDIAGRVADGFTENRGCLLVDQGRHGRGAVVRRKTAFDSLPRQHVFEQGVGAAIQQGHADDVIALLGDIQDRVVDRGAAGAQRQAGDTAFQGGATLFQHVRGGVHDAGIDIAGNGQVEQVRAMLGVIELVGNGLVNRHGDGLGGRVGLEAGMDSQGLVFHVVLSLDCCFFLV